VLVSQTASRDSDSLIQENFSPGMFDPSKSCWQHPKIRENWKMVLAAIVLLLIGIGESLIFFDKNEILDT
jgi:hypothetical protein